MAKNKLKGKKQKNVFQVANKQVKPKTRTKPVKTSLRHVSVFIVQFSCPVVVTLAQMSLSVYDAVNIVWVRFDTWRFLSWQINAVKNEKVENLNQIFSQVQRDVKSISKPTGSEPKGKLLVKSSVLPFFCWLLLLTFMAGLSRGWGTYEIT